MMNILGALIWWVTCVEAKTLTHKFGVQENKKVAFPSKDTIIGRAESQIRCAAECLYHDTCCVASFDNALHNCHIDTSGSCLMATMDSVGWTVLDALTGTFQYTMLNKIRNTVKVLKNHY